MIPNVAHEDELKKDLQIEVAHDRNETYENCLHCSGKITGFCGTWLFPCFCANPYKKVPEGFSAAILQLGKFTKVYGPGLSFVNNCTEEMILVDKRERVLDLRKQNCMTKDNIDVIVDAVVYYQVTDTYKSLFEIGNVQYAIAELSRTAMREVFGNITLQEALEDRDTQAERLKVLVDTPSESWGVDVTRVLIQEILFTPDLQASLSTKVTTRRIAESKVIGAQADVQAARLMRNAADLLNTPAAMQVRYLDAISSLSRSSAPKIVFFPSDYGQFGKSQGINMGNLM